MNIFNILWIKNYIEIILIKDNENIDLNFRNILL